MTVLVGSAAMFWRAQASPAHPAARPISANLSFSGLSECANFRAPCPQCLKNSDALDGLQTITPSIGANATDPTPGIHTLANGISANGNHLLRAVSHFPTQAMIIRLSPLARLP